MFDMKRRPTGATWAILGAILCFFSPFFLPRSALPVGFGFFFCWAAFCVASILANRMLVWAFLSGSVLFMVSFDWWRNGPPSMNEFGYGAADAIALFTTTALVVAGTGVLSVIRTATSAQSTGG